MDREQRMCEMDELFQLEFMRRMNTSTAEMEKRFVELAKTGIPSAYMSELDEYLEWWHLLQDELLHGSKRFVCDWISDCRTVVNGFERVCCELISEKQSKGGEPK